MDLKSKAKTLARLWKVARNIWKEITQHQFKKAFDSWKRRCRAINLRSDHIENVKSLHKKRICN
jgi:hypothetical protein